MTLNQNLNDIARKLNEVREQQKRLKADEDELKAMISEAAVDYYRENPDELPVKHVRIPEDFWTKTGMEKDEFLASRHPNWEVVDELQDHFLMRMKPEFMGHIFDEDEYKITKSVVDPTPEIDWSSLRAEFPDLCDRLMRKIVRYEVDEEQLQEVMKERPEFPSELSRHVKMKNSFNKFTAREKRNET